MDNSDCKVRHNHLERQKHWEIGCVARTIKNKYKRILKLLGCVEDSSITDDVFNYANTGIAESDSIIKLIENMENDCVILEEKIVHTERYGDIRFVHTPDGWSYQFDSILTDIADSMRESGEEHPYYIPDGVEPSGSYNLGVELLDNFSDTYEEAYDDMLADMSNNRIMGLIATWC